MSDILLIFFFIAVFLSTAGVMLALWREKRPGSEGSNAYPKIQAEKPN
jgi:hypothetical protein